MPRPKTATGGFPSAATVELHAKVARYRAALAVLLDLVQRGGGYLSAPDQATLRHVQQLLAEGAE